MAIWYYYNENNEKIGHVRGRDLKNLALQGVITPETKVEDSEGRTALAKHVTGLTFPEPPSVKNELEGFEHTLQEYLTEKDRQPPVRGETYLAPLPTQSPEPEVKQTIPQSIPIPMANFFYTDANGQKQGAFTPQQLKELAARGIITPDTPLETDTGKQGKAGQIKGLFPTPPPLPSVAKNPAEVNPFTAPMPTVNQAASMRVSAPVAVQHVAPSSQGYDYRNVASLYRLSTWSILAFILATRPAFILERLYRDSHPDMLYFVLVVPFLLITLGATAFSSYCMARLATAIRYGIGMTVVMAICLPLPYACLIPLLAVYYVAGIILKRYSESNSVIA